MNRCAALVLLIAIFSSSSKAADKVSQDGIWWTSMTASFKLGWVSGFATAMDSAGTSAMVTCGLNIPLYQQKYPNVDRKQLFQTLCASNTAFDYDGITMGQFVDGVDTFYKDFRNRQIEIGLAMAYVRDAVKGKSAAELEAEVTMWRRCSAAYQTGDTDQITKACAPDNPSGSKQ